jgi:hypothetical protein
MIFKDFNLFDGIADAFTNIKTRVRNSSATNCSAAMFVVHQLMGKTILVTPTGHTSSQQIFKYKFS